MIKWSIIFLDSIPSSGLVISAKWKCLNKQDELSATREGVAVFSNLNEDTIANSLPLEPIFTSNSTNYITEETPLAEITQELVEKKEFIPYHLLTKQDVLNWVWVDGGVNKTLVEESVTQELRGLINPTLVKNPLPWDK